MKPPIHRSHVILISLLFAGNLVRASTQVQCAESLKIFKIQNLPDFDESFTQGINYQEVHKNLAKIVNKARNARYKDDKRNLAVGSISIVVQDNNNRGLTSKTIDVSYVFESRINYCTNNSKVYKATELENFSHSFQHDVVSLANLLQHLENCMGDQDNDKVKKIKASICSLYEKEKKFSQAVHSIHFKISHALTALVPSGDDVKKRIEAYRKGLFDPPAHHQRDGSKTEHALREEVISELKKNYENGIKEIEVFQKAMPQLLTEFYSDFWHSEQRFLYQLLNDNNDPKRGDNAIHTQVQAYIDDHENVFGVVIHLHTYYEPCAACNFLIQSAIPKLKERFQNCGNTGSLNLIITYDELYENKKKFLKDFTDTNNSPN